MHNEITVTIEDQTGLNVSNDPQIREIAGRLEEWVRDTRGGGSRREASLFDRDKYAAPDNPYAQMSMARAAVADDDVVSGALDVLEGLALQEVSWESRDPDVSHLMNRISEAIDFDSHVRSAFRELVTYGQFVSAARWRTQTFKAPKQDGNTRARRKEYTLWAPSELTTLDPMKVVPVGSSVFGAERLAWNALPQEATAWDLLMRKDIPDDPMMQELFAGRYAANDRERLVLQDYNIAVDNLLELNPATAWRQTLTKSRYEPFGPIPLKSTFRLLDLKQQLMESDRVVLAGIANYLILVKKGSETENASTEELRNVRKNFTRLAKIPIIVSDHRLSIEIIAPSSDHTLDPERYDTLDSRILNRMLGSLDGGEGGSGDVDGQVRSRMIQRILEGRRRILKRSMERHLRDAIWNHPLNQGALKEFTDEDKPAMVYTPRNVQVDNDSQLVQMLLQLREKREISRHTILEFMGLDQHVEASRRKMEAETGLDDIFGTIVPFNGDGGDGTDKKGGRPAGGGEPPKSSNGVKPLTGSGGAKKKEGSNA